MVDVPGAENRYEAQARLAKAVTIADHIWSEMDAVKRAHPLMPDIFAGTLQADRAALATDAGQRSPSEATWKIVVERLRRLNAAERERLFALPDFEPCGHPGCLHHVTHPCEACGRVAGRRSLWRAIP